MTMTLIETKTLGSNAAQIEFTSIPQTFTDLLLVYSLRDTQGGFFGSTEIRLNSSASNHTQRRLRGNGAVISSGANSTFEIASNASGTTATTFCNGQIYIPNYTSSLNKSASIDFVMEQNATEGYQQIAGGLYSSTAAITSIAFVNGANLVAGSTISIYGILKGSSGGVTVT